MARPIRVVFIGPGVSYSPALQGFIESMGLTEPKDSVYTVDTLHVTEHTELGLRILKTAAKNANLVFACGMPTFAERFLYQTLLRVRIPLVPFIHPMAATPEDIKKDYLLKAEDLIKWIRNGPPQQKPPTPPHSA
jgi:hypothetical protein